MINKNNNGIKHDFDDEDSVIINTDDSYSDNTSTRKPIKNKNENGWKTYIISLGESILLGITIALVILCIGKQLNFKMVRVSGHSMLPTYHNNELIIFKKDNPKRNDIVVFTPPKAWNKDGHNTYIKRVVAVGGDHLIVRSDKVIVNGKTFRTINPNYGINTPVLNITVPKNKYFVMGDNYTQSNDSLYNYKINSKTYLIGKNEIDFTANGRRLKNAIQ